jgi:hypothetical protein
LPEIGIRTGRTALITDKLAPAVTVTHAVAGKRPAEMRFDITPSLCKLRKLLSSHRETPNPHGKY